MHVVFILKRYISRHVNYLEKGGVSHYHHLHPLLLDQPQGRPLDPPARFLVNVMILGQHQQSSMDVPFAFLQPTTGKLCVQ